MCTHTYRTATRKLSFEPTLIYLGTGREHDRRGTRVHTRGMCVCEREGQREERVVR